MVFGLYASVELIAKSKISHPSFMPVEYLDY